MLYREKYDNPAHQVNQGQRLLGRQLVLVVDRPVQDLPLELEVACVVLGAGAVDDGLGRRQVDRLDDWLNDGAGWRVDTFG
jgi:hypothetical protein